MKNISVGFGNAFSGGQSATALGFARNGGGQAVHTRAARVAVTVDKADAVASQVFVP